MRNSSCCVYADGYSLVLNCRWFIVGRWTSENDRSRRFGTTHTVLTTKMEFHGLVPSAPTCGI